MWREERLDEKPNKTWDEAALRWIKEMSHKKSISDDISRLRHLDELRGIYLKDLTSKYISQIITKMECTNSTKNRYFALVRAILKRCKNEWEWLDEAPHIRLLPEPRHRIRWLKLNEAERLIKALPTYLANMALFSLHTGLRQNNVFNLTWDQIDLNRGVAWFYGDQTKSGSPLGVALNDSALAIIKRQPQKSQYIFLNSVGNRVTGINSRSWAKALKKADIEDFRWHDLRHTWASWLIQAGTPLMTLKEMGGWETIAMVQRYAHLAPEHMHKHARVLDDLINMDTYWTQSE